MREGEIPDSFEFAKVSVILKIINQSKFVFNNFESLYTSNQLQQQQKKV